MNFLILNGPNLNLLGQREPDIYGSNTYAALCRLIQDYAAAHGAGADCVQSNHEGALIDAIQDAQGKYDAIILNPGAYTHYSYAIHDALKSISVPAYEVHISDIQSREAFRRISVTAPACVGQIYGLGFAGYLRAMDVFLPRQGKLCVIGDPVRHSKSPVLQNAMLRRLGLAPVYSAVPVKAGELDAFLSEVKDGVWRGFNATMPLKQALLPKLDGLDEEARRLGAVNTVATENGRLIGHNTDGRGFLAALREELEIDPAGKRITLLGAGGAARAVALALVGAGADSVTVCNRSIPRAEELCACAPGVLVPSAGDGETLCARAADTDLLINCTSQGMTGKEEFADLRFLSCLPQNAAVCDLVYEPDETQLLHTARTLGYPAMNGLGMLVHQAVFALEHFLGAPLNHIELAHAARKGLQASFNESL